MTTIMQADVGTETDKDTEPWLIPFFRNGVVQEVRAVDDSFQQPHQDGARDSVLSAVERPDCEVIRDLDAERKTTLPAVPAAQVAEADGDTSMPDAMTPSDPDGANVDPAMGILNQENVADIDVEPSQSNGDDECTENSEEQLEPSRKVRQHTPMTAEEQNMRILQLNAMLYMHKADPSSRNFKNAPASLKNIQTSSKETKPKSFSRGTDSKKRSKSTNHIPRKRSRQAEASEPSTTAEQKEKPSAVAVQKKGPPPPIEEKEEPTTPAEQRKERRRKASEALKDLKKLKHRVTPAATTTIGLLQKLGKPFEKEISQIVDHASSVLDRQEDTDRLVEELLTMEQEWKASHARRLQGVTAFLERNGIIPIGGVEAVVVLD